MHTVLIVIIGYVQMEPSVYRPLANGCYLRPENQFLAAYAVAASFLRTFPAQITTLNKKLCLFKATFSCPYLASWDWTVKAVLMREKNERYPLHWACGQWRRRGVDCECVCQRKKASGFIYRSRQRLRSTLLSARKGWWYICKIVRLLQAVPEKKLVRQIYLSVAATSGG